jgi:uncharacterized protein (TIGR00369 family)
LDQAATAAASLVSGKAAPTIDIKTSFHKAARPGTLVVTGRVVHIGQTLAFTEAKADKSGRLLATATVTSQLISAAALVNKK